MPRAITHLTIGVITGANASLVEQGFFNSASSLSINWSRVIRSGLIGGAAGILPDLLEPATSPNHRRFFHSVIVGGLLVYVMKKVLLDRPSDSRSDAIAALAGYGSHLVADAITPRSLPFV